MFDNLVLNTRRYFFQEPPEVYTHNIIIFLALQFITRGKFNTANFDKADLLSYWLLYCYSYYAPYGCVLSLSVNDAFKMDGVGFPLVIKTIYDRHCVREFYGTAVADDLIKSFIIPFSLR